MISLTPRSIACYWLACFLYLVGPNCTAAQMSNDVRGHFSNTKANSENHQEQKNIVSPFDDALEQIDQAARKIDQVTIRKGTSKHTPVKSKPLDSRFAAKPVVETHLPAKKQELGDIASVVHKAKLLLGASLESKPHSRARLANPTKTNALKATPLNMDSKSSSTASLKVITPPEPRPILTLFMTAADTEDFLKELETLVSAGQNFPFEIGGVLMFEEGELARQALGAARALERIGTAETTAGVKRQYKKAISMAKKVQKDNTIDDLFGTLKRYHFSPSKTFPAERQLKKYKLRALPAWVISHKGRQYVYGGRFVASQFFDRQGKFRIPGGSNSWNRQPAKSKNFGSTRSTIEKRGGQGYRRINTEKEGPIDNRNATLFTYNPYARNGEIYDTDGNLILPAFPQCQGEIKRQDVLGRGAEKGEILDILFYSGSDWSQQHAARGYQGHSVDYRPGEKIAPSDLERYTLYEMALNFDVRCLPTRLIIRDVAGTRKLEYYQGQIAMKSNPNASPAKSQRSYSTASGSTF